MDNSKIEENLIKSIQFRTISKDWSAYANYYSDGRVDGAHLAGNPPFVHEEKATLANEALNELWQAAEQVCNLSFNKNPVPDPSWTIYEQLDIIRQKDTIQIMWQTSPTKENPGPEVKKMVAVILKYHISGW